MKIKILIPTIFISSLLLSMFGIYKSTQLANLEFNFWSSLYLSIQLYAISGGDFFQPIDTHWILNFARFFAPTVSVISIVLGFITNYNEKFKIWQITHSKNYTLIIGGSSIIESLLRNETNDKIICTVKNPSNILIDLCQLKKIPLLHAQNDLSQWENLNISNAVTIIIDTNNDIENIRLGYELLNQFKINGRAMTHDQKVYLNIIDVDIINGLSNELLVKQAHKLEMNRKGNQIIFDVFVFNSSLIVARELLKRFPPDNYHPVYKYDDTSPEITVVCDSELGEYFIINLLKYSHWINLQKTKINIILLDPNIAYEKIDRQIKILRSWFDINFYQYAEVDKNEIFSKSNIVYVLINDLLKQNNIIMSIQRGLKKQNSIIIINSQNNYKSIQQYDNTLNTITVDLFSEVISIPFIKNEETDLVAKEINRLYAEENRKDELQKWEWEHLAEEYKNTNRAAADHLEYKLKLFNCAIAVENDINPEFKINFSNIITPNHEEMEHNRWWVEKIFAGWAYSSVRDNDLKLHNDMIEFDKLSLKSQTKDRANYLNISKTLNKAGKKIIKIE